VSASPFLLTKNQKDQREPQRQPRSPLSKEIDQWLSRFEWFFLALIVIATVALHLRFVTHVGGLWRDEANSVQVATLPHFSEIWRALEFDSFPLLFFGVLRVWTGFFGAGNDGALRGLGFIVGIAILLALWVNARRLGARKPLLSFALIGLNPMLIRYGDSTRAYGIGIFLILLTVWSYWRLVEDSSRPSLQKILLAAALALASVQCLYYNSVVLLAISGGAIAVAARDREWKTIGVILIIGALSALSLVPYLPMMRRMHEWTFLVSYPIDLSWLWLRLCEVLGSPDPIVVWAWIAALLAAIVAVLYAVFRRAVPSAILFTATTCFIAIPAYGLFLRALSYYTQPWYYITLTILVACCLEVMLGGWHEEINRSALTLFRGIRFTLAIALLSLATLPAWEEMPTRHTNVDLVATALQSQSKIGDVVVATHWQYGVSLYRYYHGPAEVITLPYVEDQRFHRYDLALKQMESEYPLQSSFSRIETALQNGHRAFFVGALRFPNAGELPPGLTLGYRDAKGERHGGNYDVIWPISAGYFVQTHARRCEQLPVPIPNRAPVQRYERLALTVAEGWR
jgi:hypothetical protein